MKGSEESGSSYSTIEMNVVVPLTWVDDYEDLVAAGADEFYTGYLPLKWIQKYSALSPVNRRENLVHKVNIHDSINLKKLADKVSRFGVPVKFTFNALNYSPNQYDDLMDVIYELLSYNFRTFIVADLGLLHKIVETKVDCKIHISGELSYASTLLFDFLEQYGFSRYIFPRKTSLSEMESCILYNKEKKRLYEYEAFILNELCPYSGAMCNTLHSELHKNFCNLPNTIVNKIPESTFMKKDLLIANKFKDFAQKREKALGDSDRNMTIGKTGCGLCDLQRMKEIGITHLKIVGRGANKERISSDIKYVKKIANTNNYCKQEISKEIQCTKLCYYL